MAVNAAEEKFVAMLGVARRRLAQSNAGKTISYIRCTDCGAWESVSITLIPAALPTCKTCGSAAVLCLAIVAAGPV